MSIAKILMGIKLLEDIISYRIGISIAKILMGIKIPVLVEQDFFVDIKQ